MKNFDDGHENFEKLLLEYRQKLTDRLIDNAINGGDVMEYLKNLLKDGHRGYNTIGLDDLATEVWEIFNSELSDELGLRPDDITHTNKHFMAWLDYEN